MLSVNYAGTFGTLFANDASATTADHHVAADSTAPSAPSHSLAHDTILVPDAQLLFSGDFNRLGNDLLLSKDGHEFLVTDYFRGDKRAFLASPDGANLSGHVVEALTGHVQYAQADAPQSAAKDIGQVSKLVGTATVIRNGVLVELHGGDRVFKGDVVQAGASSSCTITFVDGSVFGLSANARMVLNEMVYDQAGSSNSALISLVRGTVSFVAGETAKHGDMKVETPVATMGIRGTAVLVEIGFEIPSDGKGPPVNFQVLAEPDGTTGSYIIYSKSDPSMVIGTVDKAGQIYSVSGNGTFANLPSPEMSQVAAAIIQQVFTQRFQGYVPDKLIPTPQSGSNGGGGSPPATPPDSSIPKNPTPPDNGQTTIIPVTIQIPDGNGGTKDVTIPVGVGVANTPPVINVHDVVTPDAQGFSFKIADRVTITDPDATNIYHDTAVPYIAGTATLVSAIGPARLPSSIHLDQLITIDPQTGAISYDTHAFGFLKQGEQIVITIGFDSRSGPDTVHETLKFIIDGVNDPPVIKAMSMDVVPGVPLLLGPSSIVVSDPDDTSFTFTATTSHGTFQVETGDNVWIDATTFTSADLAAGHVRFVSDGSNTAPTVTLLASDGHTSGPAFNVPVDFSASNIHLSSTGLEIDIPSSGATNGFSFSGTDTGNVTTPGTPEDRIVLGYHIDGAATPIVLNSDPMLNTHDFTPVSSSGHTEGSMQSATTVLGAENNITLTQTISLGTAANYFTTTIDVSNGNTTGSIDGVRFLRNFDPDQDVQKYGDYSTFNDVVQSPTEDEPFAIISAKGVESGVTVSMIGFGLAWHASVYGFTNTDPYAPNAYDSPVDPNGAKADLSLTLTYDFGSIATGDHQQISYITTDNIATSGDNALFGTAGCDTINGLGGDDLLIGLAGADTFVFAAGSGNDTILDFHQTDHDKIDISGYSNLPHNFATWSATSGVFETVGNDTLIHLSATDSILLKNIAADSLTASDFILPDNHAPSVTEPVLGVAKEDGSQVSLDALAHASDIDGDTLSVVNIPTSLPNGVTYDSTTHAFTLDPGNAAFQSLADGAHTTVTVNYGVSDGTATTNTAVSWTVSGVNDAPQISTTGVQIGGDGSAEHPITISGWSFSDPDSDDSATPSASADHGSVQIDGTSLTYTPPVSPETPPLTETVGLTVTDSHNATDAVNFVFNVTGTGPVTLTGSDAKDVFFATANQDTFVFAPNSNHDTIVGFTSGQDHIDLTQFASINADNFSSSVTIEQVGGNSLVHLDPTDLTDHNTILVKGVTSLTANDFIIHPGSA